MIDPILDGADIHIYHRKLTEDAAHTRSTWLRTDEARRILVYAILESGDYDPRDHADRLADRDYHPIAQALREISYSDRNPAGEQFAGEVFADVVVKSMDVATWRTVRDIVCQYGIGSRAFSTRFMEHLRSDDGVRSRFLGLVDEIVAEAAADPTVGVVMRNEREGFREYVKRWKNENDPMLPWHERPDLTELLSGNVHGDESYWGIGNGALSYVRELDPDRFIRLLALFDIPHPIHAELTGSRAERDAPLLCDLLKSAPTAIEPDGSWNGGFIAPLILASAVSLLRERREAWNRSARDCDRRQVSKDDLPDREAYCSQPVVSIVEALLARVDGALLGLRWATYLVHQIDRRVDQFGWKAIGEGSGYGSEEVAILDALAGRIDPSQWLEIEPPDLPPSEEIHLEAARTLAFIAQDDHRLVDPLTFLERTPETYVTDRGLHDALSRLLTLEGSPQRWASELLGWRLLNAADPAEKLQRTWDKISGVRAHAQRPSHSVVNALGRACGDDPDAHAHDWDRLPQAVLSIGLGALDQTIPRKTPAPIPLDLWNALHHFVWERWTTDVSALNRFWSQAFVELMLRRIYSGNSGSMRSLPKANADDIAVAIRPFLGANSAFAALAINMTDDEAERELLRVAIERNGYSSSEVIKRMIVLHDIDSRFVSSIGRHKSKLQKLLNSWAPA